MRRGVLYSLNRGVWGQVDHGLLGGCSIVMENIGPVSLRPPQTQG